MLFPVRVQALQHYSFFKLTQYLRAHHLLFMAVGLLNFLLNTLAMMVTGLFLGRHVQLWEIALWVPLPVQLTSLVRRFERFVADPRVKVAAFFHPFVLASITCLGNETAYLILDCTQAGKKCRTLVVGLAYHGTVLPLAWKTSQGKKGHLKGEFHRALLQQL